MNNRAKKQIDYIRNNPLEYEFVFSISDKFYVYKNALPESYYTFLVWNENENQLNAVTSKIEMFCWSHLYGIELIRKFCSKTIKMDSSGIDEIDHTKTN